MKGLEIVSSKDGMFILKGNIDAHIDLTSIMLASQNHIILNLQGIEEINSIGVKKWVEGIRNLLKFEKTIEYRDCSEVFVRQCNYVPQIYENVKIHSFQITFMCEDCDEYVLKNLIAEDLDLDDLPPIFSCESCGEEMIPEEEELFNFIKK